MRIGKFINKRNTFIIFILNLAVISIFFFININLLQFIDNKVPVFRFNESEKIQSYTFKYSNNDLIYNRQGKSLYLVDKEGKLMQITNGSVSAELLLSIAAKDWKRVKYSSNDNLEKLIPLDQCKELILNLKFPLTEGASIADNIVTIKLC